MSELMDVVGENDDLIERLRQKMYMNLKFGVDALHASS